MTGDNGLLARAKEAKEKTQIASIKEEIQTEIFAEQVGNNGDITKERFVEILKDYFEGEITVDNLPEDLSTLTLVTKEDYGSYSIKISEIYNGTFGEKKPPLIPDFDENTLTIGEAINTDKYGQKVIGYDVKIDETGCWRLFYQDSKCTYLISDNCIGSYDLSERNSYENGSFVSTVGQRLNAQLLEAETFFTTDNSNDNIKSTAWLTDTSNIGIWKNYKNDDAVFAIGSPTVELFVASYNATGKSNTITLGLGKYGYTNNTAAGWLSVNDNKGIYNKHETSNWWLASPNYYSSFSNCTMLGTFSGIIGGFDYGNICSVRPLVCIPTSVFNSKYTLDSTQ